LFCNEGVLELFSELYEGVLLRHAPIERNILRRQELFVEEVLPVKVKDSRKVLHGLVKEGVGATNDDVGAVALFKVSDELLGVVFKDGYVGPVVSLRL